VTNLCSKSKTEAKLGLQTNPTPIKYRGFCRGRWSVDKVTIRQNCPFSSPPLRPPIAKPGMSRFVNSRNEIRITSTDKQDAKVIWQRLHWMHYTHCMCRSIQLQPIKRYNGGPKIQKYVTWPHLWTQHDLLCIVSLRPQPSISTKNFKSLASTIVEICSGFTMGTIFPNSPPPHCGEIRTLI